VLAPETAAIAASGVVNAASFTAGIAPGGLVAIFGNGLFGAAAPTTVSFDGIAATVLAATPFQVNAQVPANIGTGTHIMVVSSTYGSAQASVQISAVAPAIFLLSGSEGAIENQDGSVNSAANPLTRGLTLIAYATGLGATSTHGTLAPAITPVTALLNGVAIAPAYAGLTPGFIGLYQVNIQSPPIPRREPPFRWSFNRGTLQAMRLPLPFNERGIPLKELRRFGVKLLTRGPNHDVIRDGSSSVHGVEWRLRSVFASAGKDFS